MRVFIGQCYVIQLCFLRGKHNFICGSFYTSVRQVTLRHMPGLGEVTATEVETGERTLREKA